MDMDVAELLNVLSAKLASEGTSSRNLVAIEFDPDSGNVDVLTRERAHAKDYPDLISILRNIRQTCTKDRIGVQQLRRIAFAEEEINLELVSRSGDQDVVYTYPLEATSRAPAGRQESPATKSPGKSGGLVAPASVAHGAVAAALSIIRKRRQSWLKQK
jgi:hypothetical protein